MAALNNVMAMPTGRIKNSVMPMRLNGFLYIAYISAISLIFSSISAGEAPFSLKTINV